MHSEFRIGRRLVQPELNTIVHSGKATHIEPKVMEVLVYLARRPGEVVGRETLIRDLWGDTFVTDAALTRCIAELRKVFDDDVREPRVIQTIAKSGYRLIAPVESASNGDESAQAGAPVEVVKPAHEGRSRSRLPVPTLLIGVASLIVGAIALFVFLRPVPKEPRQVLRTVLPLTGTPLIHAHMFAEGREIAMSPDGSRVAYVGTQGGNRRLFLRVLDSAAVTPIPESDGARDPFFSPDNRWLGFWAVGKLKKASLSNLSVVAICETRGIQGASWGVNGAIVFASDGKLYRVPEGGGMPNLLVAPDSDVLGGYLAPAILPSGDVVLATLERHTLGTTEIVAIPLGGGRSKRVLSDAGWARYAPTGHLVYSSREGRLAAAPFDPILVEATGPPMVLAEAVQPGQFDFATSGSLLYVSGTGRQFRMVWVDRTGTVREVGSAGEDYNCPRLSADGRRVALTVPSDISVYDLEREALTRVTFNGAYFAIWTPDGTRLTYSAPRSGALNLVWKNANGTGAEEQLTTSSYDQIPVSWSRDGLLAFGEVHPRTKADIWLLDVAQGRRLRCFLCTDASEGAAVFSPDGRWIAYRSNESGHHEVYVRPLEGSGEKYPISNGTGTQPLWSRDGRELFYWKDTPGGMQMMAVDVTLAPVFRAGKPHALFEGLFRSGGRANYDVTADGQRFLMLQPVQSAPVTQLELVVNWFEELRARVRPTGR